MSANATSKSASVNGLLANQALARDAFILPTNRAVGATNVAEDLQDAPCTYLCGNSLGALPKRAKERVDEEFAVWGTRAVEGHFRHPHDRPWTHFTDHVNPILAEMLGAEVSEVCAMGTLTANLHLLMNSFYKPTSTKYKILCELKAFPSDQYAFASQATLHGLDPRDAIIELAPRQGEFILREEDILKTIEEQGSSIALVLLPGVQYYSGQVFNFGRITALAQTKGCLVGWDLAHAIGNIPLSLHDWNVDFAVWCSYKYINSGPGGIAGLFVHKRWEDIEKPRYAGWWGHDLATRFEMPPTFAPIKGAQGFQQSNPSMLALASLLGSLEVFKQAGMMPALRARSLHLTTHLFTLLTKSPYYVPVEQAEAYGTGEGNINGNGAPPKFTIITPADPEARGAQLSLVILPLGKGYMQKVFDGLKARGVVGDERKPDVIRLAPTPLYNTEEDCERAAASLDEVLKEKQAE